MTELEVENFFSVVDTQIKLTEQVRAYYGKEIAPDFNSFDFWQIDENKVSQLISFFLNPKESHEQGDIYLRHFLKKFKLNFFDFDDEDSIQVICEYGTDQHRRIDIVIIKNAFEQVIGIENKIYLDTTDQKDQITDYLDFLDKKSKGNYCLLYISPQNKNISGDSIDPKVRLRYESKNQLISLSYEEHIIDCIGEFSLMTENIRVKSFLKDFEKRLNKMYMGESNINSKKVVVDYINENEKNLEISFLIKNSLEEVKIDLKRKFEGQIAEIGKKLDLEVDGLILKPKKWTNHFIRFHYEKGGLLYGIIRKEEDPERSKLPEIENLLEEKLREKFIVSYWWPMYQFFYSSIDNNKEFWLDINNGTAKSRAMDFVQLINSNFNLDKY